MGGEGGERGRHKYAIAHVNIILLQIIRPSTHTSTHSHTLARTRTQLYL